MPHVEVLTSSASTVTPGWTYVPDTGFDPSQAAIKPTVGRKRGIREPGGRTDLTSRQHTAIVRHLAELDRENHRDVHIPVPVKQKDAAGRVSRGKTTPNVRRILQSQKTFRNYLDDEEAALAQAQHHHHSSASAQRPGISKVTKSSARRSSTPATPKPEPLSSRQKKQQTAAAAASPSSATPAAAPSPEPVAEPSQQQEKEKETEAEQEPSPTQLIKSEYDNDPLLKSYIPSAPSERIMQALLSEPPLSYNAARAGPPTSGKPPRYFCSICGYWGKIRCRNCPVRTCGLECYRVHEESRCGAFF
ncbi:hypothetical protein VTN00DRAFT_4699 [Thermoascus crustaceus]|uniref:uncharacterized protein n=1 Tax=Thermoascus crustaceus TaxID=5088 RepID=UPI0037426583